MTEAEETIRPADKQGSSERLRVAPIFAMLRSVGTRLGAALLICALPALAGCAASTSDISRRGDGDAQLQRSSSPAAQSQGAEIQLVSGNLGGPTAGAIVDLLKLDHFFHRCRSEPREFHLTDNGISVMRQCFRQSQLPADCSAYWPSVEKLAGLAIAQPSLGILLPGIANLVEQCHPRPWPAPRVPQRDVDISPLDVGLAFALDPTTVPPLVPRAVSHHEFLCRTAAQPNSDGLTVGEMMLCNQAGGPGRGRDFYVNRIRRFLSEGTER